MHRYLPLAIALLAPAAPLLAQGPLYFDASSIPAPPPLTGSTAASGLGDAVILGGADAGGNINRQALSLLSASPGTGVGVVHGAAASAAAEMFVFGGFDGASVTNNLFASNAIALGFTRVNPVGALPPPRQRHAMSSDSTSLLVFGGEDPNGGLLSDTWRFDAVGRTWTQIQTPTSPPARRDHALVFTQGRYLMFGGRGANGPLNDLWVFNGSTWLQITNAGTPPPPRYDHAMGVAPIASPTALAIVVHGGESGQGTLGDCWLYTGGRWVQRDGYTLGIPAASEHHILSVPSLPRPFFLAGGALGSIYSTPTRLREASVSPLGAGCAGNAGVPSLQLTDLTEVSTGGTIQWSVAPVPGPTVGPVFGVLDLNGVAGPGLPAPIGALMPGCDQHVAVSRVDVLANFGGLAIWNVPVPVNRSIEGFRIAAQALVPAPGVNPAGYVVSDALEMSLGMLIPPPASQGVITESFVNPVNLDGRISGGRWTGGLASFPAIGGAGELGAFDYQEGTLTGGAYVFRTDGQTFQNTLRGAPITVTDGRFEFTRFDVPAGVTVRFEGANPAVIRVTGRATIDGTLDVSGVDGSGGFNGSLGVVDRVGAGGGPGAGRGGDGGLASPGNATLPTSNGSNGADVSVPAGHAYAAQTGATGGGGASQFPVDGLNSSLVFVNFLTQMVGAGGGGGGYVTAGTAGQALANNRGVSTGGLTNPAWLGPPSAAGGAFDLLNTLARPAGVDSIDFYAVGGSGGGGGGSHALFTNSFLPSWYDGAGAGGGGGALVLRAGNAIAISSAGAIDATGGGAADYIRPSGSPTVNMAAVGGAGSGGSVLLQSDRTLSNQGTIDASGGDGGDLDLRGSTYGALAEGGDGGDGLIRGESPGGGIGLGGSTMPALGGANRGTLTDLDNVVVMTSRTFDSGRTLPTYSRYEVDVVLAGGMMATFRDDTGAAAVPGLGPFAIEFQAMDTTSGMPSGPWVSFVRPAAGPHLGQAGADGFRFRLILDRSFGQTVQVDEVRVVLQ